MKTLKYNFEGENYEYDASRNEILEALADIVFDEYFKGDHVADFGTIQKGLKALIDDYDLLDEMFENYEEEVKDYFEDEAHYEWKQGE